MAGCGVTSGRHPSNNCQSGDSFGCRLGRNGDYPARRQIKNAAFASGVGEQMMIKDSGFATAQPARGRCSQTGEGQGAGFRHGVVDQRYRTGLGKLAGSEVAIRQR